MHKNTKNIRSVLCPILYESREPLKLKPEAPPHEPICHSDSSAHGCFRSVAESQSHVAAGNESISRSRCQAPPTADDNVCNYVLKCSRKLTSEGIKCLTPKIWNYVKTRVFVFLAAETKITKIYVNIVADVLCNKRCILLIKLVVRSWTVRTLGWQLESHSRHGLYNIHVVAHSQRCLSMDWTSVQNVVPNV